MALYPFIFVRKTARMDDTDHNHEYIHLRQQKEMLFVFFYLWYVLEWIIKTIHYRRNAYYEISFEREAYTYENMPTYLEHRKHFTWFSFV